MALIKMSSIGITNISGKAGGTIYSRNAGGAYAKNFAVPVNPQTQAQQLQRSIFGSFSSQWRQLTQSARNAWNQASESFPYINPFGDVVYLSGISLFVSLNRNLTVISRPSITEPPLPSGAIAVSSLDVTATFDTLSNTSVLSLQGTLSDPPGTGTEYAVYATPSLSPGISNGKNRLRLVTVLTGSELQTSSDIAAEYTAVFGQLDIGAKIQTKVSPINRDTGERGADFFASGIVTIP